MPANLGFYDLRLEETRIAQAELAREYGIHGFCYYHYWFNGKRLLERPLEDMLKSGTPDFPFCICWANENWTRRWDGEDQHILMKLEYSEEDDRRHIRELFRIFEDPRYIKINGKPLFLVYRTENMPEPGRTAEIWREEARKAGVGELFLVRVESIGQCDPKQINFDAAVEFAPDWKNKGPRVMARDLGISISSGEYGTLNEVFEKNYIHRYDELVDRMLKKPVPGYVRFRCVTPSWDNSPRRREGANIFVGASPEKYHDWLKSVIGYTRLNLPDEEKLVFINAWNEWAEGNYLEPDQRLGRAYLEATRKALLKTNDTVGDIRSYDKRQPSEPETVLVKHREGHSEHKKMTVERETSLADLNGRLSKLINHERQFAEFKKQLTQCKAQIADRNRQIHDLLNSYSWKMTAPLRWLHERLSKLLR